MPTLFLLLIFMTSALAAELNNFGDFSIDTDVTGLMPAIEEKPQSREVILTEEDKLKIAREMGMNHAQGPDYLSPHAAAAGRSYVDGAPGNPTTDVRQAQSNHFGH